MRFALADTTERYRITLKAMEPRKIAALGDGWAKAALQFFFGGDRERASFSGRDTLVPMVDEDHRVLDPEIMRKFLDSITLEKLAEDVAGQIHDTYIASTPRQ
jgi:hypothetical protein